MTAQTVGDRLLACIVSPLNLNDTEAERGKKERWNFIKCVALGVLAFLGTVMELALVGAVLNFVAAPPLVAGLVSLVVGIAAGFGLWQTFIFLGDTYQKTYDPSQSLGTLSSFEAVKRILRELAPVITSGSDGAGVSKLCTQLENGLWIQELVLPRKGFLFYSLLISDQESRDLLKKICRDPETQLGRLVREKISSCWVKIATKLPDSELFKILTPDENCRQLLAQLRAHQEGAALSLEEQQALVDSVLQLTTKPGFNV